MYKLSDLKNASWRVLTFCTCIILGIIILFNSNRISDCVNDKLVSYIIQSETDLSLSDINNINKQFYTFMNKNSDIDSIILYKFVANNKTGLYKGQINLSNLSRERDGNIVIYPSGSKMIIPPIDDKDNLIQEVLLNKVHFDTISSIQMQCEKKYDIAKYYTCEKYKVLDKRYKTIVTIPIQNETTYDVVGYTIVLSSQEFTNHQVQDIINKFQPTLKVVQSYLIN